MFIFDARPRLIFLIFVFLKLLLFYTLVKKVDLTQIGLVKMGVKANGKIRFVVGIDEFWSDPTALLITDEYKNVKGYNIKKEKKLKTLKW